MDYVGIPKGYREVMQEICREKVRVIEGLYMD